MDTRATRPPAAASPSPALQPLSRAVPLKDSRLPRRLKPFGSRSVDVGGAVSRQDGVPVFDAVTPAHDPLPTSGVPEFWRRKIGRLVAVGPPVFGSTWVVSPEAIITQPRGSIAFEK